jgi:cell division septal protein FtsQ
MGAYFLLFILLITYIVVQGYPRWARAFVAEINVAGDCISSNEKANARPGMSPSFSVTKWSRGVMTQIL